MVFGCVVEEMDEANDENIIKEIIQGACPGVSTRDIKVSRAGSLSPNKTRPILVKISSSPEVRSIFFKAKNFIKKNVDSVVLSVSSVVNLTSISGLNLSLYEGVINYI